MGSWTNNTGASIAVGASTWAERTFAGAGTSYSMGVSVSGGTPGGEPSCEEEWVLASLGVQVDGGAAADPVNTGNGNFFDTVVDVPNVGSLGDPLLSRTYNSMDPSRLVDPATGKRGLFGEGWTSWLDSSLTEAGTDKLIYRDPTGRQVYIVKDTNGDWVAPPDLRASVVETGPASVGRRLEFRGGRSVEFDADGRLVAASSGGGAEMVEVDRDAATHVPNSAIFRTHGEVRAELDFTDTGADGLVDLVEGPGGVRVAYSYDSQGRLKDVSVPHYAGDPAPVAEGYEWVGGRVKRILTHLGGSADPRVRVDNTYDARGRVSSQTQANGDVTTFTYAAPDATNRRRTTVTHTGSGSTETYVYVHDAVGTLLGVTDDDGQSVGLSWQDKRLTSSTSRGGAQRSYGYDAEKRVTSATLPSPSTPGASGPVEEVTYCDPAGDDYRVRTITDAAGTMARFTYGTMGDPDYPCAGQAARPTSITEGVDTYAIAVTRYEWSQGLPVVVTDPDGVVTRMQWDTARRLLLAEESDSDTAAAGTQVTFYGYDGAGRLRVSRTPTGIETWYDHDAAGRVTRILGPFRAPNRGCVARTDTCAFPATSTAAAPAGAPTQELTYRRDGRMTSYTDQTGETWTYAEVLTAGGGSRETETGPDGNARVSVFDSAGRRTSESVGNDADGEKATTTYNYGAMGRLASVVDPTGVRTRFRYDADSNLTEVIDEDDNATVTSYDRLGRVTTQTDGKGNSSTFEYNAIGMLTYSRDRRGSSRTFIYDSLGHLKVSTNARGGITDRMYTPGGRLEKLTDPTGRATTFDYDDAGRLLTKTSPSGAVTSYAYNADDRLTSETSPEGRVSSIEYDPAGRVLSETVPGTGTTTYGYNARGDLLSRTDATGGAATWTYDPVGQVNTVTDPLGAETTFGYDSRGNRTTRTDALAGVTTWAYNKSDQLRTVTDPLGRDTTYTYDALGRLATRVDAAGRSESYGYDVELSQLTSIAYPGQPSGPGAVPTTTITYDNNGQRTKLVDAAGTTSWTYDAAGNLTAEDNPGDKDMAWAWDLAGRRTNITYPGGTLYRNTYNADGERAGIQRRDGFTWTPVITSTRDNDGLLTRQREVAGRTRTWTLDPATGLPATYEDAPTAGGGTTTNTTYTHDLAGRVTTEATVTNVTGSPSATVSSDYGYDDAGQLLTVERSNGAEQTYAYDDLGRRTSLTDTIAGGSGAGTADTTYAYDTASQLTGRIVDGVEHDYTYDASGRRTGESWTAGGTAYAKAWNWDARGALTSEEHTTGSGTGATSIDITRRVRSDGRVAQVDIASTGQPTQINQMVWDEADQIPSLVWSGQRGAANETTALYGQGLVRTDCLSSNAPAGCTGSITHDARGSAVATSTKVRAASYSPYGDESSGSLGVGFGYLDEVHIGSLIHLRARDYDPVTGTFLSPDLLDGVGGTTTIANTYHYANNDPLNQSDPTGLRPGETNCQGFLESVICEHSELFITTASITVGFACGLAAAPAGPFAAGAAGAACGGAVHRGLTAYTAGDDPWARSTQPTAPRQGRHCRWSLGCCTGAGARRPPTLGQPSTVQHPGSGH